MDADLVHILAEAQENLAAHRHRVFASLMRTKRTVLQTETLVAETRDLILCLDDLQPNRPMAQLSNVLRPALVRYVDLLLARALKLRETNEAERAEELEKRAFDYGSSR